MEEKKWALIEELEKLTEDNAADYLSPSIYGQAKIKGKFIRDETGKLVPVLVKTKRQPPEFKSGRCIRNERQKPDDSGIINRLRKIFTSIFAGQDKEV